MDLILSLLRGPIGKAAITGVVTAAGVDLHAFATWKSWQELATYSWRLAAFRWFQGAILGALTGAGLGVLL